MFNYRLDEIEKIARGVWFFSESLPCYEDNALIWNVIVLKKWPTEYVK
jgi:hypothetical protein